MAYGTQQNVAALARTWTRNGEWFDTDVYVSETNPSLTQVEEWIDQITVMLDIALANNYFIVPVIQADVIKALSAKVEALTADLCHLAHNKGRLFSDRIQQSGQDPMFVIDKDLAAWVKSHAVGLEAMGVPRVDTNQAGPSDYSVPMSRQV
jgi:hypothetical protein